ncbi:MAG: uracil-DNA glycosylase [Lachnospirales bacterium]
MKIGNDWDEILKEEYNKDYFKNILKFIEENDVMPPRGKIFNALKKTSFGSTRVVILGQDPYPTRGVANGLAFSVEKNVRIPRSLQNIYKELEDDINQKPKEDGDLTKWAENGILLLNTILTVEEGKAGCHKNLGWQNFTGKIVMELNKKGGVVFLLWGNYAKNFVSKFNLDGENNLILESGHPSPLSQKKFFGNKHFSKTIEYLNENIFHF